MPSTPDITGSRNPWKSSLGANLHLRHQYDHYQVAYINGTNSQYQRLLIKCVTFHPRSPNSLINTHFYRAGRSNFRNGSREINAREEFQPKLRAIGTTIGRCEPN